MSSQTWDAWRGTCSRLIFIFRNPGPPKCILHHNYYDVNDYYFVKCDDGGREGYARNYENDANSNHFLLTRVRRGEAL